MRVKCLTQGHNARPEKLTTTTAIRWYCEKSIKHLQWLFVRWRNFSLLFYQVPSLGTEFFILTTKHTNDFRGISMKALIVNCLLFHYQYLFSGFLGHFYTLNLELNRCMTHTCFVCSFQTNALFMPHYSTLHYNAVMHFIIHIVVFNEHSIISLLETFILIPHLCMQSHF